MALTDRHGVYGAVRFQEACREAGIHSVIGAEVDVGVHAGDDEHDDHDDGTLNVAPLVLLAASREGYANLCRILTNAHLRNRDTPHAMLRDLERYRDDLFCLTGTYGSRCWSLVDDRRRSAAQKWVQTLHRIFGNRLSLEVSNHLLPGDKKRMKRLSELSEATGVPLAATGDVRYATRAHHRRYDLLTCVREGVTVFDAHPERPRNAEAILRDPEQSRHLIPFPEAWNRSRNIAASCSVDLIPDALTTPAARYDSDAPPWAFLRQRCRAELRRNIRPGSEPRRASG